MKFGRGHLGYHPAVADAVRHFTEVGVRGVGEDG